MIRKRPSPRKIIGIAMIVVGLLMVLYFLWINFAGNLLRSWYATQYEKGNIKVDQFGDFDSIDSWGDVVFDGQGLNFGEDDPTVDDGTFYGDDPSHVWEGDSTVPYSDRAQYKNKDFKLSVPRMGVNAYVVDGTTWQKLKSGPGLFSNSDMPGPNPTQRVMIAGHRTGYGSPFYNIDKLQVGDKAYVTFGKKVYVYAFESFVITGKRDWSHMVRREYSELILTSCHPKNTSDKRYITVFRYVETLTKP